MDSEAGSARQRRRTRRAARCRSSPLEYANAAAATQPRTRRRAAQYTHAESQGRCWPGLPEMRAVGAGVRPSARVPVFGGETGPSKPGLGR